MYIEDGDDIYTYTPDLMRPFCPTCGHPVNQGEVDPTKIWVGTCPNGHTNRFLLEEEESE